MSYLGQGLEIFFMLCVSFLALPYNALGSMTMMSSLKYYRLLSSNSLVGALELGSF